MLEGTSGKTLKHWPPMTVMTEEKPRSPLDRLRSLMLKHGVGIYLVLMQDEHNSEYVAIPDKRIAYISGFNGSAGTAVVGPDFAELITDSRYWLRASEELAPGWSLVKDNNNSRAQSWRDVVLDHAKRLKCSIGIDPRFANYSFATSIMDGLSGTGLELKPIVPNLVDSVWPNKPSLPSIKLFKLPLMYSGQSHKTKLAKIRHEMAEARTDALILYALDEIAWLFNLRGGDIPYTPEFKGFSIVTSDSAVLYCDLDKAVDVIGEFDDVQFKPYLQFFEDLLQFKYELQKKKGWQWKSLPWASSTGEKRHTVEKVWVPSGATWATINALADIPREEKQSPVNYAKAIKNDVEMAGAREANRKCSLSIVQYFSWLQNKISLGTAPNEYDGGLKLLEYRKQQPGFRGLSFETISAVGANAASPHYAPAEKGSNSIRGDQVYLLDSGSQFFEGSTDITRTVHFGTPSAKEKEAYTCVLKGQLAVTNAVFPEGTSGHDLDILARQFLWQRGLNYLHGTGHGVGAYLSIHELPIGIGMSSGPESRIWPGVITSIEPGYYQDGDFGVRLENEILAVPAHTPYDFNGTKWITFEAVTLVPYDRNLVEVELLTKPEREQINAYHYRVRETLLPDLNESQAKWLLYHTQPY